MTFYLDTSVILPVIVEEATSAKIIHYLKGPADRIRIGDFAAAEVASAVSRLTRTRILTASEAIAVLRDFDVWRAAILNSIDVQAVDVRLAGDYVRRFDLMLRVPDALHVAICRRLDLTLVTLDRRLAVAAQALGVAATVPA